MALSMKTSSSAMVGRKAVAAPRASVRAAAKSGNWLPGSTFPAWLDESAPGTYGFDPLGLAKDKASFQRFQEAEVFHGRWAMLGVAGSLGVELLGFGNWYDAPTAAITGGKSTYFGAEVPFDLTAISIFEVVAFAIAEGYRGGQTASYPERIYPGGTFDPMGLSKDTAGFAERKIKEVKNGRLAMVAFIGFLGQHAATGKSPIAALADHVANPWAVNFATNGVSVPGL